MSAELWLGLVLIGLITVFSTANVAIRHVSRVRLAERLEPAGRERLVDRLMAHRDELLLTTSLGRLSGILGLVLLVGHALGARPAAHISFHYAAIFLICIFLVGITGVAIPNAWARYQGEAFLAAVLPAMLGLRLALYPIVVFLRLFDGLVRRLAGVPPIDEEEAEAEQIEQEILGAVSEGEKSGAVHEEDAEMIESVIELRDTQVGQIMTPRTEVVALPDTATIIEAKETITRAGHSRIPIYGENIDDIKGVLYAKDLLNIDDTEPFDPLEVMRKVPFVPETKLVPDLLQELREKKVHLAIVLDEYGGTAGLVTIEDIIEQIVGDIADEYEHTEPAAIRRIDPQTLEVDARVHIDELNDELKVELPEDRDYETVGGFLFSEMGKIPRTGEEFRYNNLLFRVLEAEERKINRIRVEVVTDRATAP